MTKEEFERNMHGAEAFRGLSVEDKPFLSDFWLGYIRGLRRHYHGERFGTEEEHKLWLSLADEPDEQRRQRGEGYRLGFGGTPISVVLKEIK